MIIQTNVPALKAWRNLKTSSSRSAKRAERLSSGYRINTAADDAAGLAISEKMRAQIRGLTQAERNTQDGISLVQTADGGMGEVHSMLHRMRELSVYACNEGVLTDEDTQKIQDEIDQLKAEIDGVADRTEFNKIKVLSGGGMEMVQVGENVVMGMDKNTLLDSFNFNITDDVNDFLRDDNLPKDMTTVTIMDNSSPSAPVLGEDGNPVDVTFTFQRQANGSVDITATYAGETLGITNVGTNSARTGASQLWSGTYGTGNDYGGTIAEMNGQFFIGGGHSTTGVTPQYTQQASSLEVDANGVMQNGPGVATLGWGATAWISDVVGLPGGNYIICGRDGGSSGRGASYAIYDSTGGLVFNSVTGNNNPNGGNIKGDNGSAVGMVLSQNSNNQLYILASDNSTGRLTKIDYTTGSPVAWGNASTDWGARTPGIEVNMGGGNLGNGSLCLSNTGNPMILGNGNNSLSMFDDITGTRKQFNLAAAAAAAGTEAGLTGVAFNRIEAVGGNRYLLTGSGTNSGGITQACATIVTMNDVTAGVADVNHQYSTAFDASAISNIDFGNADANGNRALIFVGNRVGINGNAQGWIGKLTDDGTQFTRDWQRAFDSSSTDGTNGTPGSNHCWFNDVVVSTSGGRTVYTVTGGTVGTNAANDFTRDVWVSQFTEVQNGLTSLMGVSSADMNLSPISADGWDTEISFNSVKVNFDPAQAIPGQTGYVTNIQIDATVSRYEWTVIKREPVYSLVRDVDSLWLQTGANAGQGFTVELPDMHIEKLGFPDGMPSVLELADATASLDYIDDAASIVSTERAKMGAVQNRLEFTMSYLQNAVENLSASESRIRDADMAKEMMEFTKSNVLQQAGMSMLAQANQSPERVLQLLG